MREASPTYAYFYLHYLYHDLNKPYACILCKNNQSEPCKADEIKSLALWNSNSNVSDLSSVLVKYLRFIRCDIQFL